jgi:hypothetical protein
MDDEPRSGAVADLPRLSLQNRRVTLIAAACILVVIALFVYSAL